MPVLNSIKNSQENYIDFFKKNYGIKILNLDQKIKNILETTNFYYLQKMEEKYGFGERLIGKFFNKGIKNQWINKLTKDQSKKIKDKFEDIYE